MSELLRFYAHIPDVEILVFDNGSTDPRMRLAMAQASASTKTRIARTEENLGFGGGFNEAVKHTRGKILYFLSDDVRVHGDFIARISDHLGCLVAGNVVGQRMITGKAGWNEFIGSPPINYLMGHFLAMRKVTFEELGGFDSETFHPYDYEDVDLSYRTVQMGYAVKAIPNLPLDHQVGGTIEYGNERYAHTVKMRAAFAEKHGLVNEPKIP